MMSKDYHSFPVAVGSVYRSGGNYAKPTSTAVVHTVDYRNETPRSSSMDGIKLKQPQNMASQRLPSDPSSGQMLSVIKRGPPEKVQLIDSEIGSKRPQSFVTAMKQYDNTAATVSNTHVNSYDSPQKGVQTVVLKQNTPKSSSRSILNTDGIAV